MAASMTTLHRTPRPRRNRCKSRLSGAAAVPPVEQVRALMRQRVGRRLAPAQDLSACHGSTSSRSVRIAATIAAERCQPARQCTYTRSPSSSHASTACAASSICAAEQVAVVDELDAALADARLRQRAAARVARAGVVLDVLDEVEDPRDPGGAQLGDVVGVLRVGAHQQVVADLREAEVLEPAATFAETLAIGCRGRVRGITLLRWPPSITGRAAACAAALALSAPRRARPRSRPT